MKTKRKSKFSQTGLYTQLLYFLHFHPLKDGLEELLCKDRSIGLDLTA